MIYSNNSTGEKYRDAHFCETEIASLPYRCDRIVCMVIEPYYHRGLVSSMGEQCLPLHIHCAVIEVCTMNGKMCVRGAGRRGRCSLQVWSDSFYVYRTMLLPWARSFDGRTVFAPTDLLPCVLCLTFFIQFSSYVRGMTLGIMS